MGNQFVTQGVGEDVQRALDLIPRSAIEAVFFGAAPFDDKPWLFTLVFCPTKDGLAVCDLFCDPAVLQAVSKKGGVYPPLGLRPARFFPGPQLREVLTDSGHDEESIRQLYKGKGKGKASASVSGGAQNKRAAERRGSALAADDGRGAKR